MNGTGGIKHSLQAKIAEPEGMDRIPKVNIQAPNAVPWRQLVEDVFSTLRRGTSGSSRTTPFSGMVDVTLDYLV